MAASQQPVSDEPSDLARLTFCGGEEQEILGHGAGK
jgi:hypothetical protein